MGKSQDDQSAPRDDTGPDALAGGTTGTQAGANSAPSKRRSSSRRGSGRREKNFSLRYSPIYRMLKKMSEDAFAVKGEQFDFKYNDLIMILIKMKAILLKGTTVDYIILDNEKPLVRCPLPCVIVGDIHGQFPDLSRIFEQFKADGEDKPGWITQRYVFLGDYVDRGKQSLEVIVFVFLMKISFTTQVYLLRGNHECKPINRVYGFQQELTDRFGREQGTNLFHMFNEAFTHLPLACLVGDIALCMHGGISPKLTSLNEINKIPKPLVDPNTNELACDLMWADPMIGLRGFKPNAIRGVSVHFGEDVLHTTMAAIGVRLIVRGHQMMMNGFNFFGHQKLVTVFTAASYYPDRANRGAAMYISSTGSCGFHVIVPHGGEKVFLGDHEDANKYDVGFILSVGDEKKLGGRM